MRFQYDVKTESNVKINDRCALPSCKQQQQREKNLVLFRYEFPVRLDFTKYLKEPEDVPSVYKLFAVLVHSGAFLKALHFDCRRY